MRAMFRCAVGPLAVMAALGVLCVGPASAALPEFKGQNFTHEHVTFTGTGGTVTIREAGGPTFTCTTSAMTGEIVSPTEVANVILKFSSGTCTYFCRTSVGLWETRALKGRIAYLSKPSKIVGLLLEAATEPITTCTHYEFAGAKIRGSAIAEIGPVNTASRKTPFTLAYTTGLEQQSWRHFEGEELIHSLNVLSLGGVSNEFAIEDHQTLTMAREIRIEA